MMGKRNVYAYLARQRKAGPHGGSRRPEQFDDYIEDCPACSGTGIDFEADDARHSDGCCLECDGTGIWYEN